MNSGYRCSTLAACLPCLRCYSHPLLSTDSDPVLLSGGSGIPFCRQQLNLPTEWIIVLADTSKFHSMPARYRSHCPQGLALGKSKKGAPFQLALNSTSNPFAAPSANASLYASSHVSCSSFNAFQVNMTLKPKCILTGDPTNRKGNVDWAEFLKAIQRSVFVHSFGKQQQQLKTSNLGVFSSPFFLCLIPMLPKSQANMWATCLLCEIQPITTARSPASTAWFHLQYQLESSVIKNQICFLKTKTAFLVTITDSM